MYRICGTDDREIELIGARPHLVGGGKHTRCVVIDRLRRALGVGRHHRIKTELG